MGMLQFALQYYDILHNCHMKNSSHWLSVKKMFDFRSMFREHFTVYIYSMCFFTVRVLHEVYII